MKTNAKEQTLKTAIELVNKQHGYQLYFNRFDVGKKHVEFTVKTPSGVPGAKVNPLSGRNIPAASWHAHGYLFEAIFDIEPDTYILSLGKRITRKNIWDHNPVVFPMYNLRFSDYSIQ